MTLLNFLFHIWKEITSHVSSCDLWKMRLHFLCWDLLCRWQRLFHNDMCKKRWQAIFQFLIFEKWDCNFRVVIFYADDNVYLTTSTICMSASQYKGSFIIPRLGGGTSSGNPYNSRESLYLRKRFFTCPFILPKDSKKSKVENFSPPLRDALKNFRPPLRPKT